MVVMIGSSRRRAILRWGGGVALLAFAGCSDISEPTESPATSSEPSPRTTTSLGDGRSSTSTNATTTESDSESDDPPALENLAIEFGPYDPDTGFAGDFRFDEALLDSTVFLVVDDRIFLPFGTRVEGPSGPKLLPENSYVVPADTGVRATHDGVVTDVSEMYSGDYAVTTRVTPTATWMVSHEHVRDPAVAVGDHVDAGQELALVSTVDMAESGYGWTELAVWKGGETASDIVKICPFGALDADRKPPIGAAIQQFVRDWEGFVGRDVYDQDSWVASGCRYDQLTEAQSQSGG